MRVAFLGNAPWSVPVLEVLAESSRHLALVVTRGPRRAGRGNSLTPTPVAEAARRLRLPLREVDTVKSGPGFEALAAAEPDAMVVVAYGEILPQRVLDLPRVAPVNLHFSLLPSLRGAAPVQHAILQGLEVTGVTTIRMDAGMDTGPILLQREEDIRPEDDAGSLGDRLAASGGDLLVDTLDGLEAGSLAEQPQDHERATYAPKLTPGDRVIDWSRPPGEVILRIRALSPGPGAETRFRGRLLKVLRARPGTALQVPAGRSHRRSGSLLPRPEGLGVWAGDEVLLLQEVQPEGRRRMSGAEFMRGYRPEPGETLG